MKKTIVREYQLPSSCIKGKQELTIAFLTDLHDQVTGEDGGEDFSSSQGTGAGSGVGWW